MNANRFSIRITLATALAALLLSAAQFAGIASLAAPQRDAAIALPAVAQLPLVVVVGRREAADAIDAVHLPTVTVTAHAERTVARATTDASAI
jgi:hypothetical protein